jgi:hypothetical protein
MCALGPRIVEDVPPDLVLLPSPDPVAGHLRDRQPIRATPAGIDESLRRDGNT